jgi:hypothetical protein
LRGILGFRKAHLALELHPVMFPANNHNIGRQALGVAKKPNRKNAAAQ